MTRARDVANLIGSGNYSSTTFTATAGQTAFTISHTQGFVQVFMNGLLLDETVDYTSNGSAVTLTSGAAAGDEIEVVAYNTFSVGDAVPASGGTFTGAVTHSGNVTHTGTITANNDIIANKHLRLYTTDDQANQWYVYNNTDDTLRFNYNGAGNDEVVLDTVGRMSVPNQPSAGLRLASGDQGAYNATTTNGVMKPSTILHNIGNHYNNSTGLFTCPVAGRYLVQFSGNFYNSGAGTYHIITIMKNGGSLTWNYDNDMGASWKHISNTTIVSCAANDTLNINNGTQSGSGGGSDVGKYSYISFHYLG